MGSPDWCLLAASFDDRVAGVGVDIQAKSSAGFNGFQRVAMTAWEREKLGDVPRTLRPEFQTRLWVRKEAVLKALGIGLAMDPATLDVSGPIPHVPGKPALQGRWQLEDVSPSEVGLPEEFTAGCAIREAVCR
jgi:4'-phosphopantetheinyl transferase